MGDAVTDSNPDTSQQRAAVPTDPERRVRDLENAYFFARGMGFVALLMLGGLGMHAVATRDLARDTAAQTVVLQQQLTELRTETRAETAQRATDDRTTRDTLAAIQSDLRALRIQLDLALAPRPDDRPRTPSR